MTNIPWVNSEDERVVWNKEYSLSELFNDNEVYLVEKYSREGLCIVKAVPMEKQLLRRDFEEKKINKMEGKEINNFCEGLNLVVQEEGPNWKKKVVRHKRQSPLPKRYSGQVQTQYIAFNNGGGNGKPGTAEAISQPDLAKATVSGVSGIGQAQSQSGSGFGCDDCFYGGPGGASRVNVQYPFIGGRGEGGRYPDADQSRRPWDSRGTIYGTPSDGYIPGVAQGVAPGSKDTRVPYQPTDSKQEDFGKFPGRPGGYTSDPGVVHTSRPEQYPHLTGRGEGSSGGEKVDSYGRQPTPSGYSPGFPSGVQVPGVYSSKQDSELETQRGPGYRPEPGQHVHPSHRPDQFLPHGPSKPTGPDSGRKDTQHGYEGQYPGRPENSQKGYPKDPQFGVPGYFPYGTDRGVGQQVPGKPGEADAQKPGLYPSSRPDGLVGSGIPGEHRQPGHLPIDGSSRPGVYSQPPLYPPSQGVPTHSLPYPNGYTPGSDHRQTQPGSYSPHTPSIGAQGRHESQHPRQPGSYGSGDDKVTGGHGQPGEYVSRGTQPPYYSPGFPGTHHPSALPPITDSYGQGQPGPSSQITPTQTGQGRPALTTGHYTPLMPGSGQQGGYPSEGTSGRPGAQPTHPTWSQHSGQRQYPEQTFTGGPSQPGPHSPPEKTHYGDQRPHLPTGTGAYSPGSERGYPTQGKDTQGIHPLPTGGGTHIPGYETGYPSSQAGIHSPLPGHRDHGYYPGDGGYPVNRPTTHGTSDSSQRGSFPGTGSYGTYKPGHEQGRPGEEGYRLPGVYPGSPIQRPSGTLGPSTDQFSRDSLGVSGPHRPGEYSPHKPYEGVSGSTPGSQYDPRFPYPPSGPGITPGTTTQDVSLSQRPGTYPVGKPGDYTPQQPGFPLGRDPTSQVPSDLYGSKYPPQTPGGDTLGTGVTTCKGAGDPCPPDLKPGQLGESQAQVSLQYEGQDTTAMASSQGKVGMGTAQTQVSGTYTGTGAFSAQAETSDREKGAKSQIQGGESGATSSAQGTALGGQSQAQMQLNIDTGNTEAQSQIKGYNFNANTQVVAGMSGGMADAQSVGNGPTSSQAQIGFIPQDPTKDSPQTTPYKGGGSASAQSSGYAGQAQSQMAGSYKHGISYSGAAQASSGAVALSTPKLALPAIFNSSSFLNNQTRNISRSSASDSQLLPLATAYSQKEDSQADIKTSSSKPVYTPSASPHSYDEEDDEYNDEDYNDEDETEDGTPSSVVRSGLKTVVQPPLVKSTERRVDHHRAPSEAVLPNKSILERDKIHQSEKHESSARAVDLGDGDVFQPGEEIPGAGGLKVPVGFRGRVHPLSGEKPVPLLSNNDPSATKPLQIFPRKESTIVRNIGKNTPPSYQQVLYPATHVPNQGYNPNYDTFVTVTNSVTGELNKESDSGKKYAHTYYTKSSTCGFFTFTCSVVSGSNGRTKICRPKEQTNPDGTPCHS